MATLYRQSRAWVIQFRDKHRKMQTLQVGRMPAANARQVLVRVEALLGAHLSATPPDPQTIEWVRNVGDPLRKQLARVGLIAAVSSYTVGGWIDHYIEQKRPVSSQWSVKRMTTASGHIRRLLGESTPLLAVTAADAEGLRDKLLAEGKAVATAGRIVGDAKSIFGRAVKARLLADNPFAGVSAATPGTKHKRFIDPETAHRVMGELPDTSWRLLFALARWGGLRTPSEVQALKWADIHWDRQRFTVRASKKGGEPRDVPLFPEIERAMLDHREAAGESALVLPKFRGAEGATVRKPLVSAIERAGVEVWPRLWHNLRSTRQTELERDHPTHVVCAWLGNSPKVAAAHYLQVTDDDYTTAVKSAVRQNDSTGVSNPQSSFRGR